MERALSQWRKGEYKPLQPTLAKFNRSLWGPKTAEFMASIDHLSEDVWKSIFKKAQIYKGKYKAQDQYLKMVANRRWNGNHSSGRAKCFIK